MNGAGNFPTSCRVWLTLRSIVL